MTNNQLIDERVTSVIERLEHYACNLKWTNVRGAQDLLTAADGLRELQERRKAAMDSEPVAWRYRTTDINGNPNQGWSFSEEASLLGLYQPLYAAPHAAPVVPEEVTSEDCPALVKYDVTEVDEAWARGFNACCAAMLQAEPVTTANKLGNSPVIPDTWIPVSERLPEEGGRYWCYVEEQNSLGKSHYQWNCSWNGEIWGGAMMYGRVTHWMPLPAAPQEVKGE